jgi:uncharacterized protein involved in response to NO
VWFTIALASETIGAVFAAANSSFGLMPPAPGVYPMSLYGGVFGWVLSVAMRAVPMFITGRRVGRLGPFALVGLNGGVLLACLSESFSPTAPAVQILFALADLGVVVSLLAGSVEVGAWQPEPRHALSLSHDRIETRFFRFAFACAGLAAAGLFIDAISRLAGAPAPGLWRDATLHLLTVGFMIGMICAMGFRFVPVIEGVRIAMPRARSVAFWSLVLAVLFRTAEGVAPYLYGGLLRLAAFSGFLAWLTLLLWGLSVGVTMARGAALRRSGDPN